MEPCFSDELEELNAVVAYAAIVAEVNVIGALLYPCCTQAWAIAGRIFKKGFLRSCN